MKSIAFYVDGIPFIESTVSGTPLEDVARKFVDQWCAMAGMTPMWVNASQTMRKTNSNVFWSWEELLEKHGHDHTFIFLDEAGDETIEHLEHPDKDVIYCIGADYDEPFGSIDLSKQRTVRLPVNRSCYGFTVVPVVTTSRMFWDN